MRLPVVLATTATVSAFSQGGGRPPIRRSLRAALRSTTATASPYSPLASFMAEPPKTRSQGDVPDDVFHQGPGYRALPEGRRRGTVYQQQEQPAGHPHFRVDAHVKAFDAYLRENSLVVRAAHLSTGS